MANAENGRKILDALREAKPRLVSPLRFAGDMVDLWRNGLPKGASTGWPELDEFYTVAPGQFTVLTGWPGSGKSEFLDAILVNLARQKWHCAVFSFENQPVKLHIQKIMEKMANAPFPEGVKPRIPEEKIEHYLEIMDRFFRFTETTSGAFSLNDCLEEAAPYLAEAAPDKRAIVIDPWNELEHWIPSGTSETNYISENLSMIRNWARTNSVHVWIVAHPAKQRREDGKLPIPKPDMISGGAHWWNKADCCLCVVRDLADPEQNIVDIHVQKIRFKHIGRVGQIRLSYDRPTGIYSSIPRPLSPVPIADYYKQRKEL